MLHLFRGDAVFDVKISKKYIVKMNGMSDGSQIKYFKDNYWYKVDNQGHEGITEFLVSKFLTFTSLNCEEYVLYESGFINQFPGCRSKHFLQENEQFVTFRRLYLSEFGKEIGDVVYAIPNINDRIKYTIDILFDLTGIDVTDYLRKTFSLDLITLNEDRHFNNLGLILSDNTFSPAPIFDNGRSLLTTNVSVNWYFPMEDNVKRVVARPFSGSHRKMFDYFGKGFEVNWNAFITWLDTVEDCKEKDVFLYQVEKYAKLWEDL